jgi:hypothetical protein
MPIIQNCPDPLLEQPLFYFSLILLGLQIGLLLLLVYLLCKYDVV